MSELRQYQCPWCGATTALPTDASNCPACGTSVDVRLMADAAGWYELPALRDMARLQFGKSTCQVEGSYVPVADFKLAADDRIYFRHHVLLWKDDHVALTRLPLAGAWRRFLAGLPVILAQAQGPGRLAVSQDAPGEFIAIPLNSGQSVDVREGMFLVATSQVGYDWFTPDVWYQTAAGTHYPLGRFMDRFTATDGHGVLLLHGHGNVFVRHLEAGQSLLIKPPSLVYKEPGVNLSLLIEHPGQFNKVWSRRYVWLKLTGVGRVAIQSAFPHWKDPTSRVRRMSANARVVDW